MLYEALLVFVGGLCGFVLGGIVVLVCIGLYFGVVLRNLEQEVLGGERGLAARVHALRRQNQEARGEQAAPQAQEEAHQGREEEAMARGNRAPPAGANPPHRVNGNVGANAPPRQGAAPIQRPRPMEPLYLWNVACCVQIFANRHLAGDPIAQAAILSSHINLCLQNPASARQLISARVAPMPQPAWAPPHEHGSDHSTDTEELLEEDDADGMGANEA